MILRVVKAQPKLLKKNLNLFEPEDCRCAVTISKKVSKKAVTRNRLRRLLHNHLAHRLFGLKNNNKKWALLSLKPGSANLDSIPLLEECDKLLSAANLF